MIIKTNPDEIENFLVDASNFKGYCDKVYFPESEEEIAEILKEADKNNIPVTVAGNGTGLTGVRVPLGGVVISTEKLNKIIEINSDEMFAVVEPGVLLSEFQNIIREKNLLYPPDPTERNCFIGATAATNASGEKTFKYGPTRDFILALNVLLANGELLKLKRGGNIANGNILNLQTESGKKIIINLPDFSMPDVKNASGYFIKNNMDAIDLFIGSEGTLGVISKIKLKLLPLPEKIISSIIFFNDEKAGLDFIKEARERSFKTRRENLNDINALALEFFGENSLKFLMDSYSLIPSDAKAAIWFEQEVDSTNEDLLLEKWLEMINNFKIDEERIWFALDEKERKKMQEFRHTIAAKVIEYISNNNLRKLGTDTAVPHDKFEEFYFFCKKVVEEGGIYFVAYGHFGNSHIHLNMLPKNEEEYLKGKEIYKKICEKAIELGGTISAEHGVGKIKKEYLKIMYGEEGINKMKKIKEILDPGFILGRGSVV